MHLIITIDGPAGSGKSWLAGQLAAQYGLFYLSTGLLYRALAYGLVQRYGAVWANDYAKNPVPLSELDLELLDQVEYHHDGKLATVYYQGLLVSDQLHTPLLDALASAIATQDGVRVAVNQYARMLAIVHDLITDGRDCGTVMFPDATCKLFLTADVAVRAQRIFADAGRMHDQHTYEQVLAALVARDKQDSTRQIAPLRAASDAVLIDNSSLTAQQTVELAKEIVEPAIQRVHAQRANDEEQESE